MSGYLVRFLYHPTLKRRSNDRMLVLRLCVVVGYAEKLANAALIVAIYVVKGLGMLWSQGG